MGVNEELRRIKEEVINCKKCPLYKTRRHPVIGEGSYQARVMFIGEAPGVSEDQTGYPFCGAAGKILDELLNSVRIKKEEVFIANILKCRPPGNRDPRSEEIKACTPYLERQIKIIAPKVICPLGNFATAFILERYGLKNELQGISKVHGKIFGARTSFGEIKIIPMYHPAVAVYNINTKDTLLGDFVLLKGIR